ncbi:hypothetical protein XAC3810_820033 [Xanthomonas citri pv. citri]|uniref:Uncharacterized protein n=1 Tax=Xanthomonas citri pv. citri TaxID=611301 RepID=A0A0U5FKW7_XANCI|nr:hypothetical protein XAC3810_820033 [Xanthomonas citri pv. citri]CEE58905.1 hypothetical protein XAC3608_1520031 [Xanthomonas citri pv. citri]CEG19239.1 hypothetical protein XAC3562_970023 [Xanthomonas citri pv. citri]CEH47205.1 hypothetical protein XAC3610_11000011 [Xanthomonas citri pv. citri]CEH56557.1 hypothetical protein XACS582_12490004 [Xanthomonas citri pv. citri]
MHHISQAAGALARLHRPRA